MKNIQKDFIVPLLIVVVAVLIIGGGYYIMKNNKTAETGDTNTQVQVNTTTSTPQVDSSQTELTILVPDNLDAYRNAMNEYTSNGGENPSKNWPFIKKVITVPFTTDTVKASAEAAAEQISTHGGPTHASIAYLKIKDSMAYVLLDIDLDGWAGVSFSTNQIHPLVEKTLLQFSQIQNVKFGFAPGDSRSDSE